MSLPTRLIIGDELQFDLIQRGTIMIFFIGLIVTTVNMGIQLCKGTLHANLMEEEKGPSEKYKEKQKSNAPPMNSNQELNKGDSMKASTISVNKIGMVSISELKSNTVPVVVPPQEVEQQEDESTCSKIHKRINYFNTLFAMFVFYLINFFGGTNYPFAFTWFLLLLIAMIVFSVVRPQRMCTDNRFAWLFLEGLWVACLFFFAMNFWTIANQIGQPYLLIDG